MALLTPDEPEDTAPDPELALHPPLGASVAVSEEDYVGRQMATIYRHVFPSARDGLRQRTRRVLRVLRGGPATPEAVVERLTVPFVSQDSVPRAALDALVDRELADARPLLSWRGERLALTATGRQTVHGDTVDPTDLTGRLTPFARPLPWLLLRGVEAALRSAPRRAPP